MRFVFRRPLALVLLLSLLPVASAEEQESVPSVTIMHAGAETLLKDLRLLSSLTTPKEQAGWKKIIDPEEGILEIFLLGIERTKPMRVDVLLDGASERLRMSFPIADFDMFVEENLGGFDIELKKIGTNFFQLSGGGFEGFVRYISKYAVFGEGRGDVPADLKDPLLDIKPLVDKKYSVAAQVKNAAAGQDARRKAIGQLRENLDDVLKKKSTESDDEFALRKAAFQSQMDEVERFFVDASQIVFGVATNEKSKNAYLDVILEAIPDTDLERDIQQLLQKPSYFARITRSKTAILFDKTNLPLNEMRKTNLLTQFKHARAVSIELLKAEEGRSDEQRQKGIETVNAFFDMLEAGTKDGLVDGFVEVRQDAAGKRIALAGNVTPDGTKMEKVLELFAQAKAGRSVERNVDKVGDVAIHKVNPAGEFSALEDLFGKDVVIYVGTSPKSLWYACGAGSLDELKSAIASVAPTKVESVAKDKATAGSKETGTTFGELYVKCGPWIQFLDERQKRRDTQTTDTKLTDAEKTAKERQTKLRRLAVEAFETGDDAITVELNRVENRVEGRIEFAPGLLRFVGKVVADFANENL